MDAYRERLQVPVSYWLLAALIVPLLGGETYIVASGFIPPLVIGALYVLVAAFLLNWNSATVEVTGDALRAGRDTLPLSAVGEAIALDERQSAALRGPQADPAARVLLRPYLRHAVCVRLAGTAADGAPYWLIATRRPAELAAAIERARQAGDWQSVG